MHLSTRSELYVYRSSQHKVGYWWAWSGNRRALCACHKLGHTVSKTLTLAFALVGLAAPVYAGDLDTGGLKDPLPDTLSWQGVTL